MNKKIKKNLSFTQELFKIECINNIIAASFLLFYNLLAFRVFEDFDVKVFFHFLLIAIILFFSMQFLIGRHTTGYISKKINKNLKQDNFNILTPTERTLLIKDLNKFPKTVAIKIGIFFAISDAIILLTLFIYYKTYLNTNPINTIQRILFLISITITAISNSVFHSYQYTEELCAKKINILSKKELDKDIISKHKYFGINLYKKNMTTYCPPIILVNIVQFCFLLVLLTEKESRILTDKNLLTTIVIMNSFIILSIGSYLHHQTTQTTKTLNEQLQKLNFNTIDNDIFIPITFNNNIHYNIFLINEIFNSLKSIANSFTKTFSNLIDLTKELSFRSQITSEQATNKVNDAKKNIEKINSSITSFIQIENITTELRTLSFKTETYLNSTIEYIEKNFDNIKTLININKNIINKINFINSKIDVTWGIIKKIELVSEEINSIAYNAELEYSSSKIEENEFHIIAKEIRILAKAIVDAIFEIKEKMKDIQYSADNLIIKNEANNQKMETKISYINNLEENFNLLKISNNITEETLQEILNNLNNQKNSFLRTADLLSKINSNFNSFLTHSKEVNNISNNINNITKQFEYKTNKMEDR